MTYSSNPFFDELAKLLNNTAGTMQTLREEFESLARVQTERLIGAMDLAKRDDVEATRVMLEGLALRIAEMERRLGGIETGGGRGTTTAKRAAAKPVAKKTAAKKTVTRKTAPKKSTAKTAK